MGCREHIWDPLTRRQLQEAAADARRWRASRFHPPPPEAATSAIEAITGFSAASWRISRHMRSEASASPPGLSTRSTTAATW